MQAKDLLRPFRLRPAFFTGLLHTALVTILIGACVTHFWGEQGEVHIRLLDTSSIKTSHSTLSIFLWDSQVVLADDGKTPVDYVSELRILDRGNASRKLRDKSEGPRELVVDEGIVRINKPLKYHGYRFCEADYDSDERGVVLTYNYDPWGTAITYAGYAMLLLAMLGFFFQKRSYFRALLRPNKSLRTVLYGLCPLIIVLAVVMTKVVTPKPPLVPVLQTPLLGIHVSVIMLAYTLFAVIMVDGILGLSMPKRREQLMHLSQVLLYPAEFCLTAGIFIGAVWANLSWGRYWGWDPKETWALITMLVYAVLLHWHLIAHACKLSKDKSQVLYHVLSIVAFLFVLFTYFGVSYLLGGLHSYT